MYRILIAQPCYSTQTNRDSMAAATMSLSQREDVSADYHSYNSSSLTTCFNVLWCRGLNAAVKGETTHFAMLHNDVIPEPWWLDKLLGIMERRANDLVSVAIPIKDTRGVTSCGLGDPRTQFDVRRFTMAELYEKLPATFDQADVDHSTLNPECWPLVFNTGCWLADLRNPAWRELDEEGRARFFFTMNDEIRPNECGEFHPYFEPEDWFFSKLCAKNLMTYSVTREVRVKHHGEADYTNERPWGTQTIDELWRNKQCV